VVGDIVGGRLGAQVEVVTHVLLDESVAVMAANDRVGQFEIFDHRLEFAPITLGDLATEDSSDLIGLANGTIGVEKPLSQRIQRGAALEDQIVAVFHLGEKQSMLAAGLLAFPFSKERRAGSQPLLPTRE